MNLRRRKLLLAAVLGSAIGFAAPTVSAMTLAQAVNKVRRDTGGKVLSARTEVRNNRQVHIVKVLTKDGKVRYVQVAGDPVKPRRPRG